MFNVDDYWILKSSYKQRLVDKYDLINFINVEYLLLKKTKYNIEIINKWLYYIDYINKNVIGYPGPQFLHIPLPPFNPEKIVIKK